MPPPIPRRTLSPAFKRAIRTDARGIVRLSALAGFAAYPQLSALLHVRRVRASALLCTRLQSLASLVGYDGEVFRG